LQNADNEQYAFYTEKEAYYKTSKPIAGAADTQPLESATGCTHTPNYKQSIRYLRHLNMLNVQVSNDRHVHAQKPLFMRQLTATVHIKKPANIRKKGNITQHDIAEVLSNVLLSNVTFLLIFFIFY